MKNKNKFIGTGVALVTPFKNSGEVDYKALEKLVNHIVKGGCEYLVVLGTTGEGVTLTSDEKKKVIETVITTNKGRLPIVLGLGGNNTLQLMEEIRNTDFNGIDAILSVSPAYNKPSQAGIVEHYKMISKVCPVPIVLYNVPGRTGSNMLPTTVITIAQSCKNVIAIKEASGNVEQVMSIIEKKPKDFLVISGDDGITLPLVAAGAVGVISVVANAYPKKFSQMVRSALKNDYKQAQKIYYPFHSMIPLLFQEGNPGGVKAVLSELKIMDSQVRLPLVKVSSNLTAALKNAMKSL
ncbi:MAG: 4-hydroxy-tetrahydrodipicolinate synthase [Bacteroidota bacterium]